MACNCNEEGKVINIGMGCCLPIVANADAYYTKSEIDEKIDEIVISGGGITSGEVQTMIDESIADKADKSEIPTVPTKVSAFDNDVPYLTQHQSLSGYATEQWVLDKHYISGVDLSDCATKGYVSGFTYDKATIDEKVAGGGTFDPTQYYTTANTYNKTQTNEFLNNKLDASAYTPCDLSNYYTKSETNNQISNDTADMATKTWVQNQGYLTQHQNLDNYYTKSETSGKTEIQNALNSKANKTEIPSLDGYATENWVQSQGYLTQHQDLSNYALKSEIPDISGKQDISGMTAYTQTTAFTAHTGDTNVHVTQTEKNTWNNKVSQTTLNNYLLKSKIWCGTQSQYDSITTKDSETIYLIHE